MKRILWVIFCILLALSSVTLSAMAEGSLASPGNGLVDYYMGMSKSRVQEVAPMFEEMDDNLSVLDIEIIGLDDGLAVDLCASFEAGYVSAVDIVLNSDEEIFRSSVSKEAVNQMIALSLNSYIGIPFDWLNDCDEYNNSYICESGKYACGYSTVTDGVYTGICTKR